MRIPTFRKAVYRKVGFAALLISGSAMTACASVHKPPAITYDNVPKAAILVPEPARAAPAVEMAKPVILPSQLKPLPPEPPSIPEARDPKVRVAAANAAARVEPSGAGYVNAVQVYPFSEGSLYQLYASPGEVTDVELQEGEQLVGSGPVAAGDTIRWIIGDTESGTGAAKRVHILVKPSRADLTSNLVINTDRRTYHIELRSTVKTYMASLSWQYPQDQLMALAKQTAFAEATAPVASGIDIAALNFRYTIEGDKPPWRPIRAFDDGRQVIISFPPGIGQGEMPPLFVVGPSGKTSDLVNYRVRGDQMIVDRLFAAAELRLGDTVSQSRVRIVRTDGAPR